MFSFLWTNVSRTDTINQKITDLDNRISSLEKELEDSVSKFREKNTELEQAKVLTIKLQHENRKLQRMLSMKTENEDERKERLLNMLLTSEEYNYLFELTNKKIPYLSSDGLNKLIDSTDERHEIYGWGFDDNEGFNMILGDAFVYEIGNRDYELFDEEEYVTPVLYHNDHNVCQEPFTFRDFIYLIEKLETMPDIQP